MIFRLFFYRIRQSQKMTCYSHAPIPVFAEIQAKIRRLQVQLESMEVGRQHNIEGWDVSEAEEELQGEGETPVE